MKKLLLLILLNTMIAGIQANTDTVQQPGNKEQMMQDFFNPTTWKTFCTGRYLIDLPATLYYEVEGFDSLGKDELGRDDIVWEKSIDTPEKLATQINQIKQNIANFKKATNATSNNPPRKDGKPYFLREVKYKNGGTGILARAHPTGNGMEMYNYFVTEKPFRVFYYRNEFVFDKNIEETIALNQKIANALQARDDNEIPRGPGLCIYGGFVAGDHQDLIEESKILLSFPYYNPKYQLIVSLSDGVVNKPMTLHPKDALPNSKVKRVLRNTDHKQAGKLSGMEYAYLQKNDDDDVPRYVGYWYYPGGANSSRDPFLAVIMGFVSRGYKKDKAFPEYLTFTKDKQMLQFWDDVLKSVRKRPE